MIFSLINKKNVFTFFVPMVIILILSLVPYNELKNLPEALIIKAPGMGEKSLEIIKKMIAPAFSILATCIFLILAYTRSIQSTFRFVFGSAILIMAIYFFYLLPNADSFQAEITGSAQIESFTHWKSISNHVLSYWVYISFYLVLTYWPSALFIIFYGFANQILRFNQACLFYPLFGVIGTTLPLIYYGDNHHPIWILERVEYFKYGLEIVLAAAISLILYQLIFYFHQTTQPDEDKPIERPLRYGIYLGMTVFFAGAVRQMIQLIWKWKSHFAFPSPENYTPYMGSFFTFKSSAIVLIVSLMLFLIAALVHRKGRAWKNYYSALVIANLVVGVIFFIYNIIQPISKGSMQLSAIGGGYQIFVSSITLPLLLCLKELAYFPFAKKIRFGMKIWIDLVFSKMGMSFGVILSQSLLFSTHVNEQVFSVLFLIFSIIGLVWLIAGYHTGKFLDTWTAQEKTKDTSVFFLKSLPSAATR